MRPVRLDMEGFASFRQRVEIDFVDADLFVLSGSTGAGKSSVIDAITFALYGTVPRYDHQTLVWPVISQGLNEAKVRLDFVVGALVYSAVRVVKRTANGATTKEARLEDATGRVLAGTADELSDSVERLLGLPYQHFIRCVVLPQGDFAEFLHAKPAERQDLLVQLLGWEIYARIRQSANQRADRAVQQAALIRQQLETQLAGATQEALAEAQQRVQQLEELRESIEAAKPELEAATSEAQRAKRATEEAEVRARLLAAVEIPVGIEKLARAITDAANELAASRSALDTKTGARDAAQKARNALPERAWAESIIAKHELRATLEGKHAGADKEAMEAKRGAEMAAALLAQAEAASVAADEQLSKLRREHSAAHLAAHLVAGEPCPVCLQPVKKLPSSKLPADLKAAEQARAKAERAHKAANTASQTATSMCAERNTRAELIRTQLDQLESEFTDQPARESLQMTLGQISEADQLLREATAAELEAHEREQRARDVVAGLDKRREAAQRTLAKTRDDLARQALGPPALEHDDLHQNWTGLLDWARQCSESELETARGERTRAQAAQHRLDQLRAELLSACAQHSVEVGKCEPHVACVEALAHARAKADTIERDVATASELRAEAAHRAKEAAVAKALGLHLNAKNFEGWLMRRALQLLVTGANRELHKLSAGAYSLGLDDTNQFVAVDHHNADERRMARTLSGGETFLASLALALALADQIASLAAGGAARLQALFLDEGFGTLDADTLDTVATAIEELGSRGRMVGIVTHVRELAERIPVRFEVRKVDGASQVQKVVA